MALAGMDTYEVTQWGGGGFHLSYSIMGHIEGDSPDTLLLEPCATPCEGGQPQVSAGT